MRAGNTGLVLVKRVYSKIDINMGFSTYYIVILIIGALTLSKKIKVDINIAGGLNRGL